MDEALEKKKKEVYIEPLGKWKRILSFLSDFFINLILTLILFNLAIYPLGGLVFQSSSRYKAYQGSLDARDSVLYGNNLLFAKDAEKTSNDKFDTNLEYTFDVFLKGFVTGEGEGFDIFKHYAVDIRNDRELYVSFFTKYDADNTYFIVTDGNASLKDAYIEEWTPFFDPDDTPSIKAQTDRTSFQSSFFLKSYSYLLADIYENDLAYVDISYKEMQDRIYSYSSAVETLIVSSVFVSYALSSIISYIIIPMITKRRRTLSMLFLHHERVDSKSFECLSRPRNLMLSIYGFALGMGALFFVPYPIVSFNELFSLGYLFPISLISLSLALGSLIMLLIDQYNRDMSDRFTSSVMISEEALDEIYRNKGYGK